jgi:predicted acetyltransferase
MLQLRPAVERDRETLERLMQFYLYDFSEYLPLVPDHTGAYPSGLLARFLPDPANQAWLLEAEGVPAGFGLVSPEVLLPGSQGGRCVRELFVMRGHRRRGAGRDAARRLFALHPGRWEVRVVRQNVAAAAFWRRVIGEYTRGEYQSARAPRRAVGRRDLLVRGTPPPRVTPRRWRRAGGPPDSGGAGARAPPRPPPSVLPCTSHPSTPSAAPTWCSTSSRRTRSGRS